AGVAGAGAGSPAGVQVGVVAVLVDQQPVQVPKRRGPELAGVVNLRAAGDAVGGGPAGPVSLERQRVEGPRDPRGVKAVAEAADADARLRLAQDVGAHALAAALGVPGPLAEHQPAEVAPTLPPS